MDNYTNKDCSYYFLQETAIACWKNNDTDIQNRMLLCITKLLKENWFKRVVYKKSFLAEWSMKELAEDAFLFSWEKFNEDGRSGKSKVKNKEYTGYLANMFRNNFLKELEKIKKNTEGGFINLPEDVKAPDGGEDEARENAIALIRKILGAMDDSSVEMINWRYIQKLSFDEIARRKGIKRESCIQFLWRCKKQFIELYKKYKNTPQ